MFLSLGRDFLLHSRLFVIFSSFNRYSFNPCSGPEGGEAVQLFPRPLNVSHEWRQRSKRHLVSVFHVGEWTVNTTWNQTEWLNDIRYKITLTSGLYIRRGTIRPHLRLIFCLEFVLIF